MKRGFTEGISSRGRITLAAIGFAALGCSVDSTSIRSVAELEEGLTAALSMRLSADGKFPLPQPDAQSFPQVDYPTAAKLADAFLATYGEHLVVPWSAQRGSPVVVTALRRCGDPLFAHSAYDLSSVDVPRNVLNRIAGQYVFHYCDQSMSPTVLVSVSEVRYDISMTRSGRLRLPLPEGSENVFDAEAIPPELRGRAAIGTAEEAAALVWSRAGQRVSVAPKLIRRPAPYPASFARWHVSVETPAQVRVLRTGVTSSTDAFVVGVDSTRPHSIVALARLKSNGSTSEDVLVVPAQAMLSRSVLRVRRLAETAAMVEPVSFLLTRED